MKKLIAIILSITLCAVVVLSECSFSTDSRQQVRIGYFNNITHPQALYMKAEGTLQEALGDDTNVSWTAFNAGPAEVTALFSGNIDIGYIGPVPAINASYKTMGDVVVLSGATKGGAVIITRKDANIDDVSDLAGKNVAIPQLGNTQHLNLLDLLSDNGLKPTTDGGNVTVCAVSNADVGNTMARGDIDAALVPEPWGATILGQYGDEVELFLDYDQIMGGDYDVAVVVVRKDFLKKHPDIVKKFMEQHNIATDELNNNSEESLKIINKEIERATGKLLSDDIINEAFTRIGVSTELNKESMSEFAKISAQQEFIEKAPDEASLYAEY